MPGAAGANGGARGLADENERLLQLVVKQQALLTETQARARVPVPEIHCIKQRKSGKPEDLCLTE